MQMVQKEKLYSYSFKIVLYLILLICLYNVISILFLSPYRSGKLRSRISGVLNAVETKIKNAGPKETENIIVHSNFGNKTNDSALAHRLRRTNVFAGQMAINEEKAKVEVEAVPQQADSFADNTEIIFKGFVNALAYIDVKKEINGQWHEHGFPTKVGEKIGNKKVIGGKILDFTTNYVLQDIICNLQRPVTLMKRVVILNEKGEFAGIKTVRGASYFKSTAKIKVQDGLGKMQELWLMDSESALRGENDENVEKTLNPAKAKHVAP